MQRAIYSPFLQALERSRAACLELSKPREECPLMWSLIRRHVLWRTYCPQLSDTWTPRGLSGRRDRRGEWWRHRCCRSLLYTHAHTHTHTHTDMIPCLRVILCLLGHMADTQTTKNYSYSWFKVLCLFDPSTIPPSLLPSLPPSLPLPLLVAFSLLIIISLLRGSNKDTYGVSWKPGMSLQGATHTHTHSCDVMVLFLEGYLSGRWLYCHLPDCRTDRRSLTQLLWGNKEPEYRLQRGRCKLIDTHVG